MEKFFCYIQKYRVEHLQVYDVPVIVRQQPNYKALHPKRILSDGKDQGTEKHTNTAEMASIMDNSREKIAQNKKIVGSEEKKI